MRSRAFPPLQRSISTVVLGTFPMAGMPAPDASRILGQWLDLGGTVLDTAMAYGDGEAERVVGRFLASSGHRGDVVILTKGCHPLADGRARVTPAAIHDDLSASLRRLGTDHIDIYMLHRDDVSVSVEPLIEALEQESRAGRVLSYGASNWTSARIVEADAVAARIGTAGFTSSSSQLSLASQRVPTCDGCLSARDDGDLAWYARSGMPLFAWAALAGGFFRDVPQPDPDVERIFGTPENRERSKRAGRLADDLGRTRSQVALAWVLHQPFPAFPVVASGRTEHLRELAAASDISLSQRQVAWLDLAVESPDAA
jgi:aryl-alcohol dehydrogenase-like predicted oxidoreductase